MKTGLFRSALVSATAALLVGGASIAFAASPSSATTAGPPAITQVTQATPATPAATATVEPTEAPSTGVETPETSSEAPAGTTTESGVDASGGHQDAPGQNVDHQFDGQE